METACVCRLSVPTSRHSTGCWKMLRFTSSWLQVCLLYSLRPTASDDFELHMWGKTSSSNHKTPRASNDSTQPGQLQRLAASRRKKRLRPGLSKVCVARQRMRLNHIAASASRTGQDIETTNSRMPLVSRKHWMNCQPPCDEALHLSGSERRLRTASRCGFVVFWLLASRVNMRQDPESCRDPCQG